MTSYKVGYLIGSLATKSINRKLALALTKLAPPSLEFTEISFRELPLYSYDYDSDYPPVARAFKDAVSAVDALLFVTPEYNRSIPGGLKNAIDWASRPYGTNSFTHKPSVGYRCFPGRNRHRRRTAESSQCSELLQFAADERAGGLYSVHAGPGYRRRRSDCRIDRRIPTQLYGRIPYVHRAGAVSPAK